MIASGLDQFWLDQPNCEKTDGVLIYALAVVRRQGSQQGGGFGTIAVPEKPSTKNAIFRN